MLTIQQATPSDLQTLAHITKEAYGGSCLDTRSLELYFAIQADGGFLALVNEEPAGMVFIFDYETFASVGALGVLPAFQGQGVGRILMEHVEVWGSSRNISSFLLDATEDGAKLYQKLGYNNVDVNYRFGLQERNLHDVPKGIAVLKPEDLDDVLEFDAPIFGANRKRVLQTFLNEHPERGFCSRDELGKINGFVIAQTSTIGPWVATNPVAAEKLLQATLSLDLPEATRVMLPEANRAGKALLERYHFAAPKTLRHMVKGHVPNYQRQSIYSLARYALG
ncbi:MAG: GNAT family N-acetyltransferase [Trueperaceae bacterium]